MGAFAGSWQRIRGVACCAVRWQVGKKDPRECGSFRVTAGKSWLQTGAALSPVGGESAASAAPGEVSYGDADSSVRQDQPQVRRRGGGVTEHLRSSWRCPVGPGVAARVAVQVR